MNPENYNSAVDAGAPTLLDVLEAEEQVSSTSSATMPTEDAGPPADSLIEAISQSIGSTK